MKKVVLYLLLLAVTTVYGQTSKVNLIPQPVDVQQSSGNLRLSPSTTIGYSSPEGRNIADMLAQKLNRASGYSIKTQQGKSGSIQLNLNTAPLPQLGNEG